MTTHIITFQPADFTIDCAADELISDAAIRQGVKLPLSCKNGVCLICRGGYHAGELEFTNSLGQAILEQDNQVLCCVAKPQSDIEIVMNDVNAPDHKPEVTLACQIPAVTPMADNIYRVELLAPAGTKFDYWPGQYLMLHVEDENGEAKQFPYSIACAPGEMIGKDARQLELHIAANGPTAQAVIEFLKKSVVVKATLPGGNCLLNNNFLEGHKDQPLLMVAAGSGFSQLKALIEGALAINPQQEIHLYWSNRASIGFYLSDLPQQWAHDYENFHYHPIIEQHADDWNGRAGWIYQVIHEDFDDLSQVQMFACGSPNMVYGTLDQLEKLGLTQDNMHSDVFAYAPRP